MGMTADALKRMRDMVGDDDLVVADILQSFVDEVDSQLELLGSAAVAAEAAVLRRVAHTLKSSCRDLGDLKTADLCASLEAKAHSGDLEDSAAMVSVIVEACRSLKFEVEAYVASLALR